MCRPAFVFVTFVAASVLSCGAVANEVCSELDKIVSQRNSGFASLKGPLKRESRSGYREFQATYLLPGADECLIWERPDPEDEAPVGYVCRWNFPDAVASKAKAKALAAAVAKCGKASPPKYDSTEQESWQTQFMQNIAVGGATIQVKSGLPGKLKDRDHYQVGLSVD